MVDVSPARGPRDGPAPWLTALEPRALLELGSIHVAAPWLSRINEGDQHPVLVLPGFTAGDRSTAPLRRVLRNQGYRTYGWGLGQNMGPTPDVVEGLVARLAAIHSRDGRAVSLVGWSLGGIYARELAREFPAMVRQVVTLGSPFRLTPESRSAASPLYDRLRPLHAADGLGLLAESDKPPLTVPATSIYTRTDGVVRWWQCLESAGPLRENIEVIGSHSGLGFNPAAVYAVGNRLAQPADAWQPFLPPRWARRFYPRPSTWREGSERTASDQRTT